MGLDMSELARNGTAPQSAASRVRARERVLAAAHTRGTARLTNTGSAPHRAAHAHVPHQAFHGAAGHPDAFAVELGPDLRCPVHAEVLGVHPGDVGLELLVPHHPGRHGPALGGPVRRRGELQRGADRLDPEAVPVSVDVGVRRRPSSSVAKKSDADRRISLARRSSKFSRSSCLSRSRSSVLRPGRSPASTSARRTHLRTVSAAGPSISATAQIASHSDP
jgi:hypothetical protein